MTRVWGTQGKKGLTELSRACGRYGAEIQEKVQNFDAIHSITITKGARVSEAADERPVNKQAPGTVFVGNVPQRWTKAMVRAWLQEASIGLEDADVVAVQLFGQYKEGQQIMVECKSGEVASTLVDKVLILAESQKKSREPLVYEARKLNLTLAEKQAAASANLVVRDVVITCSRVVRRSIWTLPLICRRACACGANFPNQPRRIGSFGASPRDSTGILSPTGTISSTGSASGWGGSGVGTAAGSSHETSLSPREPPKVRFVFFSGGRCQLSCLCYPIWC